MRSHGRDTMPFIKKSTLPHELVTYYRPTHRPQIRSMRKAHIAEILTCFITPSHHPAVRRHEMQSGRINRFHNNANMAAAWQSTGFVHAVQCGAPIKKFHIQSHTTFSRPLVVFRPVQPHSAQAGCGCRRRTTANCVTTTPQQKRTLHVLLLPR